MTEGHGRVAIVTGKYFASRRQQSCEFAKNEKAIARLDEICAGFGRPH
jgi:hypothetical protein